MISKSAPHYNRLFKHYGSLYGTFIPHALQAFLPLINRESLIYNSLDLYFARIQIRKSYNERDFHQPDVPLGNWNVSEKEPMMVISSPKIFEGGHDTREALLYTP